MVESRGWRLEGLGGTVNKEFAPYVTKMKIETTCWGVKEQIFGGDDFLGISV
jgi:hypothetical protein